MKLRRLSLSLSLVVVTACSGGGGNGTLDGDAGNPTTPGQKLIQDINNPISSNDCIKPFFFVDNWGEELMSEVRTGDAACTKKVLELSKIDVNTPQKAFGHDKPLYPLWHALTRSALFFAAKGNNNETAYRVIKVLVEAGARLDIKNEDNLSPLQFAIENDEIFTDYPVVASYLILTGKSNLLEFDKQGLSPYHRILQRASISHLQLMIEKNIDINISTQKGMAPLQLAFDAHFLEGIELLISKGIRTDFKDGKGNSSLQRALQQNYDGVAKILIEKDLNLNSANTSGETALFTSIQMQKSDLALQIMTKDINVDLRTNSTTALHLAISKNLSIVVDALLERVKSRAETDSNLNSVVHLLVDLGTEDQLNRAITRQFAQDTKNNSGETPLHRAVVGNKIAMAKSLLASGANVKTTDLDKRLTTHKVKSKEILEILLLNKTPINDLDNSGQSPLSYAAQDQNRGLVEMFVKNQADVKWVDTNGKNLILKMIEKNNIDLAQYFIDQGVNVNATDKDGNTALFFANTTQAVEFLASKVNVNALNSKKESALLRAVEWYISSEEPFVLDLVNKLIEKKADVQIQLPKSKGTLLHLVMSQRTTKKLLDGQPHEYLVLAETLINNSIKINAKDNSGNTALHYADTIGEIELLLKYDAITNLQNNEGKTPINKHESALKKQEKQLKIANESLELLEAAYEAAKASGDTFKQTQLLAEIKQATKDQDATKTQIDITNKMIQALK